MSGVYRGTWDNGEESGRGVTAQLGCIQEKVAIVSIITMVLLVNDSSNTNNDNPVILKP